MNIEEKLNDFLLAATKKRKDINSKTTLDFIDGRGKGHILEFLTIGKWRFMLLLLKYKIIGYMQSESEDLKQSLSDKNKTLYQSLNKRFPEEKFKIIRIQKYKHNKLYKYKLYILMENEGSYKGLEATIL